MAGQIDVTKIQEPVRQKYAAVSSSAEGKFNYPTGRAGAISQHYDHRVCQKTC